MHMKSFTAEERDLTDIKVVDSSSTQMGFYVKEKWEGGFKYKVHFGVCVSSRDNYRLTLTVTKK